MADRKPAGGGADEAWKVLVCAREYQMAESARSTLTYVLAAGAPGNMTAQEQLDFIAGFSGRQIADALAAYLGRRLRSIEMGLGAAAQPAEIAATKEG